jgi:hypothetical protein
MPTYFTRFPKTLYSLNDTSAQILTNILFRFGLEKSLKQNTSYFFNYNIVEGETPEIIAAKLYGSPNYHWLILLMNEIVDVENEWPLQYDSLQKFINKKYSQSEYADTANTSVTGATWARGNIHSYYKEEITITPDGTETSKVTEIDLETFNELNQITITKLLPDNTSIQVKYLKYFKTYYEYELELNESRRIIRLLKKEFINSMEQELEDLFNE